MITAWLKSQGLDVQKADIDGKIHRASRGRHHNKSAWYIAWAEPFDIAVAGDWRTGEKWEFKGTRTLTRSEKGERQRLIHQAIAAAERERLGRQKSAALRAVMELRSGTDATDHPYIVKKSIQAHGAVQLGDDLLIPTTTISGEVWGLQRIVPGGAKFFLSGQCAKGMMYRIGELKDRLYICEGFATGATIHEATGDCVLCAWSAGNLLPVATAARQRYPHVTIIIAGDNDAKTPGNPGRTHAEEVAKSLSVGLSIPEFSKEPIGTDFNDLALSEGLEEVRRQLK